MRDLVRDISKYTRRLNQNFLIITQGGIEVLEKIRKKIGKTKLIILDGGIRTGSDVVKACSLGANLVAIGRPVIYGLVANGSDGIANTFKLFEEEYNNSKMLSGY